MSDTIEVLQSANVSLRASIHAAHDHLHHGRIDEAHEALHCGGEHHEDDDVLPGQNINAGTAATINGFIGGFNGQCQKLGLNAAIVAFLPSATRAGHMSIQLGGSVEVIQWLRERLGMGPTRAVGDHGKTGRNDSCPCGSGAKFKKCCGKVTHA